MGKNQKRRVRIESGPDNLMGWHVKITDVDTGEAIDDYCKAVIVLIPGEVNQATFTYYTGYRDETAEIIVQAPEVQVTCESN